MGMREKDKITDNLMYLPHIAVTAEFETLSVRLSPGCFVRQHCKINTTIRFYSQNSAETSILLFLRPHRHQNY